MTTTTSNSNGSNNKQRLIAIAAVVVVALLVVNGILLYNKFTQDKKISEQTTELEEQEKLKAELEKQYFEALSELEEMRTDNEELNLMIEEQQAELKDSKDRIQKLIANEGDLKRARNELRSLRQQVDQYLVEIKTLKEENQLLADQNTQLSEDNTMLSSDLDQQRSANQELSQARAELVSANSELENQNRNLSSTVTMASVVKVNGINVDGMKNKGNGKSTKEKRAKNVDHLKICFNTTVNEITTPGQEEFYIRIISPTGETLAIEELGSGILTNSSTNEQIRYTQIKDYNYSNDATQLCALWEPGTTFPEGNYDIEIYNKGHLAGAGSFELK